jgi:hypothetical protein
METTVLQEKLASLPEEIQRQVADYIDFLIERYQREVPPLTDAQQRTLEGRYQGYLNNSSQAEDLEEVKNRLLKKYELPG